MIPRRIQMSRTKTWRDKNPDAVIIDRRTRWGNPWGLIKEGSHWCVANRHGITVKSHPTREAAIASSVNMYDSWLRKIMAFASSENPWVLALAGIKGLDVACWCPIWDKTTPCDVCGGRTWVNVNTYRSLAGLPRYVIGEQPCPACEGTGLARNPCHGDALLQLANPEIRFPWAEATP